MLKRYKKALILFFILGLSLFFFSDNKADPDLWGHLIYGEYAVSSGEVLRADIFSYSYNGADWVNHEWLAEVLFYKVFSFFGGAGLITLKILIGLLISLMLFRLLSAYTKSLILRIITCTLSVSVISYGFATRPQVFTYLFFTALVFILALYDNKRYGLLLFLLPAIFALWANMHGGFLVGLGVLILYAGHYIYVRKGDRSAIMLALAAVLAVLATLINPEGAGLWKFLFSSLSKPRVNLPEWSRISVLSDFTDFIMLGILSALILFFSKRKKSIFDIFLISSFFIMSFLQKRHIPLFAVLFCSIMPVYLSDPFDGHLLDREKRIKPGAMYIVISFFSVFFIISSVFVNKTYPMRIEINKNRFPVEAVDFIKKNELYGNMYVFFDWAQMCIYELYPDVKVYFDGRYRTVYDQNFIDGYFEILYGKRSHADVFYGPLRPDIVLLHRNNPLFEKLSDDDGWVEIYRDYISSVFVGKSGSLLRDEYKNAAPIPSTAVDWLRRRKRRKE